MSWWYFDGSFPFVTPALSKSGKIPTHEILLLPIREELKGLVST